MTDDDTTSLQEQLVAHRRTLATLLRQVATHTAAYAPPAQISGIVEARREIARLKAALRNAGVVIEDQAGDEATAEGEARAQRAPGAAVSIGRDQINAQDSQGFINQASGPITQNFGTHHHHQPRPPIDLAQAQRLLDLLPLDQIPAPAQLPPGSRMQLLRNPLFVGREADLKAIAQQLKNGRAAAITTGIGGVGKTQLASEFAHRYGQFFAGGVFWFSFADPAGVDGEIAACGGAGALELYTDAAGLTQAEQVAKVYAEWALSIPRLLIFDNCEDEALLAQRMPKSGGCRVLVTSRRGQWSRRLGIAALLLGVLSRAESITLLRSHRDDINNTEADAIADLLGDLPLAISLAGSYLETYCDEAFGAPTTYLASLRAQLLAHRSMSDAERSVRATFDLSYQRLDAANPVDALAITALARAVHLAPGEPFPRALLLATLGDAPDDEEIAAQRADAVQRLIVLGLLEVAESGALRIHRLIVVFAQAMREDADAQAAVEQVLVDTGNRLVNSGFPASLLPVLAHLRHAMTIADPQGDALAGSLANALGRAEEALTNYSAARPLYERALQVTEQANGPQHPDTATSLDNLGMLLRNVNELDEARPLLERALKIREQVLGPQHPDTATSLANWGYLLHSLGDLAGAKSYYERALVIREQVLGEQHPDTARGLNNLGYLLHSLGDLAGAKPYYERALAIREQVLGEQHPDTALSLNSLGYLLHSLGDLAGAKTYYERALATREQVLGEWHPNTATSLNNLGLLLQDLDDLDDARQYLEQALAIYEYALGLNHPTTCTIRANLAALDAPAPFAAQQIDDLSQACATASWWHSPTQRSIAQQIADLTAQAEAAVAMALLDPSSDHAALAEQIEARALQAEDGEAEGSPSSALAAHLRALAAQLTASPADSA